MERSFIFSITELYIIICLKHHQLWAIMFLVLNLKCLLPATDFKNDQCTMQFRVTTEVWSTSQSLVFSVQLSCFWCMENQIWIPFMLCRFLNWFVRVSIKRWTFLSRNRRHSKMGLPLMHGVSLWLKIIITWWQAICQKHRLSSFFLRRKWQVIPIYVHLLLHCMMTTWLWTIIWLPILHLKV